MFSITEFLLFSNLLFFNFSFFSSTINLFSYLFMFLQYHKTVWFSDYRIIKHNEDGVFFTARSELMALRILTNLYLNVILVDLTSV